MTYLTGLFLIDAPASALNNLGSIPGARTDNTVGVKMIKTKEGAFPYVSAQAFRYWLRTTLEANPEWKAAPIYREEKVAYTDANPILYWDDDLFGYMRAPSKKSSAVQKREADESRQNETPTTDTITRVSPFRVSTLVSIAPVIITEDFGVMSRHEGDPVPHEHQFYRATLRGLFSLNIQEAGTFSYQQKTGFRNLDDNRQKQAKEAGLQHVEKAKAYRLPQAERLDRITALLDGLAQLEGGAKQTIHYTDVAPPLVIMAVTKGGNHIFGHIVGADKNRLPVVKTEALAETLTVFKDEILSDVYVGWTLGYLDEERANFEAWASEQSNIQISHPRQAFQALRDVLNENPDWLG
ncbi:MAG: type I-B CRISPR-associated protein Cas7/Cst2/DevR [Anaerolineales bacterium]|nr:type I-B CRISPR-associated protein Cas7/Cst2/DevR [Anaerolineales bacterium]